MYTETFSPDTGLQADTSGASFVNYPEWTFSGSGSAQVDLVGELVLSTSGGYNLGTVSSNYLTGLSQFDLSTPLVVSAEIGSREGNPGSFNSALIVGNIRFLFHPGYGGGAHRVQYVSGSSVPGGINSNTNMGFTPGVGDNFTPITVTVTEVGSDYQYNYSIGSYSNVVTIAQIYAGAISEVGLSNAATGTSSFRNFSVSPIAVPEPSAYAAIALGVLGLAIISKRRIRN
ncbi:MAG: PEP-CTERM sorting domain-containing protein [Puniceicoccaceae bacterium]